MTYTWCRRPGRDRSGQRPGGCRKEWRQTWTARRQQHNQQPATSATRRRTSDDDQICNAKIDDWLFWTSCRQYFSRCNTKNEILKMILRMIICIKNIFCKNVHTIQRFLLEPLHVHKVPYSKKGKDFIFIYLVIESTFMILFPLINRNTTYMSDSWPNTTAPRRRPKKYSVLDVLRSHAESQTR